mmetsp:Transcript_14552/g.29431  ORF Transcript_14552/g.29431 Transcript_14552/m.29431 type:complete len:255 (+) Transcript_14552:45-809(+)
MLSLCQHSSNHHRVTGADINLLHLDNVPRFVRGLRCLVKHFQCYIHKRVFIVHPCRGRNGGRTSTNGRRNFRFRIRAVLPREPIEANLTGLTIVVWSAGVVHAVALIEVPEPLIGMGQTEAMAELVTHNVLAGGIVGSVEVEIVHHSDAGVDLIVAEEDAVLSLPLGVAVVPVADADGAGLASALRIGKSGAGTEIEYVGRARVPIVHGKLEEFVILLLKGVDDRYGQSRTAHVSVLPSVNHAVEWILVDESLH